MLLMDDLEQEPTIDEAELELARRKHKEFIKYLWVGNDSFIPGRQIDLICERIDRAMTDFRKGKSTFLCIKVPFRHSKSTIISRYLPCKFIGEFPDKEVIVATYSASLCQTFSRFARNVMRSDEYAQIYPGTKLSSEEQSVASWGIEGRMGKVHWLGMEGSVTGKGGSCFPVGTKVSTESGLMNIEELCKLNTWPKVLAFNHGTKRCEWKNIIAVNERISNGLTSIVTEDGKRLTSTPDHRVFIEGKGYTRADSIQRGDKVLRTKNMSDMRGPEKREESQDMYSVLPRKSESPSNFGVHFLPCQIREAFVSILKGVETKMQRLLLLGRVLKKAPRSEKCRVMRDMQRSYARYEGEKILQPRLQKSCASAKDDELRNVRGIFPKTLRENKVLLKALRGQSALEKNDRDEQFTFQTRRQPDTNVFGYAALDLGAGRKEVRSMRNTHVDAALYSAQKENLKVESRGTPFRLEPSKQQSCEFDNRMQSMPHDYTQIESATVSSVTLDSSGAHTVYDIQVEDCHNFFANEILVHNCIIIDDFFKGREEASSETVREKRWDVITNELLTRRADPAIVIILATPWHIDDPFGRIREQMKLDPKYPKFEEIKIPARDSAYPTGYLWSEKFSNEWYESQFATLGPYYSSSLLQCDPTPRFGNIFRVDKIKLYDDPPDDVVWTRGWDLASSEKSRISPDPDYTVGIKLGIRWMASGVEGQSIPIIYIDDMIRGRWEAMQRKNIIKDTAVGDGMINVGVENFGNYKDAYTEMCQILNGLRVVKGVQLAGDKVTKWAPIEAAMAAGNVHMRRADWNNDLIYEMSLAPSGKHDDIPDSLSVSFSLHNPHLKLVWPSYSNTRTVPMKIDWGKANPYHTLHYGALSLQSDLSMYFVGALWDRITSKLYIYSQLYWKNCNQMDVIKKLTDAMRFKEYRVDKFIGSENMFSSNMYEKSVAKQLNRQLKTQVIPEYVTIHEPIHYNFFGSIQQGEELFRNDSIVISNQCPEAARQFAGWAIQKGKPSEEDCGYCECLCLILSELQRKRVLASDAPKTKIYEKIS